MLIAATQRVPKPVQRFVKTRRYDIDAEILKLLESRPRTASNLFRRLNPGMRKIVVELGGGWKSKRVNVKVDKRTLKRHLGYLERDGTITHEECLKVLKHERGIMAWLVKYYRLRDLKDTYTPPGALSPRKNRISVIHNPFYGEEGALRFIRWLSGLEDHDGK